MRFEWLEDRTLLSVFVVSNTTDSGPGSLHQAILDSNADTVAANTIDFAISGAGIQTILPLSALPAITQAVLLDGFSEPGYAGLPLIELNGNQAGAVDGLTVTGSGVTIRGMAIDGFRGGLTPVGPPGSGPPVGPPGSGSPGGGFTGGVGIHIEGPDATGNWILGNVLGTHATGPRTTWNYIDIAISNGAHDNLIGTNGDGVNDVAERNIISGAQQYGLSIVNSSSNVVSGNFIGTDSTGTIALGNWIGVSIENASFNTIGGSDPWDRNLISGNFAYGVQIDDHASGNSASGNVIAGNVIGSDVTESLPLGNGIGGSSGNVGGVSVGGGVSVSVSGGILIDSPSLNTIGGTEASAGNLITDNAGPGVQATGGSILGNRIYGNTGLPIELSGAGPGGTGNLVGSPTLLTTLDGQLEGFLSGQLPNAAFTIQLFASPTYRPDGAGDAQDFLGSMTVMTNNQGNATFVVPFSSPAGMPVITATATGPTGNSSEVSGGRQAFLGVPVKFPKVIPGQRLEFSAATGNQITLKDPAAGPVEAAWDLSLTVSSGTLRLTKTAGLTGSGDGTGSLAYHGSISSLNAALDGMIYSSLSGTVGGVTLDISARSQGALPLTTESTVLLVGQLFVTTNADAGPGSLRQAILDFNSGLDTTNTIEFAIPGSGLHTISLQSPLPAPTSSVVFDATTQPSYNGIPLVAINPGATGSSNELAISGSGVVLQGIANSTFSLGSDDSISSLTVASGLLGPSPSGLDVSYHIDVTTQGRFIALIRTQALSIRMDFLDSLGSKLVHSDGGSPTQSDIRIDENLAPGSYTLILHIISGVGAYVLKADLTPEGVPYQPVSLGANKGSLDMCDFEIAGVTAMAVLKVGMNLEDSVQIMLGNGDGTFRRGPTYMLSSMASSILTGDFNGDGRSDLAILCSGCFSVLLGNGDGTFQPDAINVETPSPTRIASGDFNGDGRSDLAITSSFFGTVSIFLSNPDGSFEHSFEYIIGEGANAIATGDFNRDGHDDLAIGIGDSVAILLGNGDGTFQTTIDYPTRSGVTQIVTGDFNGDGYTDLAVVEASGFNADPGVLDLLQGNSDGTFQPTKTTYIPVGISPEFIDNIYEPVVAGDFNGDGFTDLAVSFSSGFTDVFLGGPDGSFKSVKQISNPSGDLYTGDYNGDGRTDLAVLESSGGGIFALLGNGDGSFQIPDDSMIPLAPPIAGVVGDFNGDGRDDIAYAQSIGIGVLLGNGDGTFQQVITLDTRTIPHSIVTGDFNGDGRVDLAFCVDLAVRADLAVVIRPEIELALGNGDGTFQPAKRIFSGDVLDLVAGDFNGDGRTDLAVISRVVTNTNSATRDLFPYVGSVLLSEGNGIFIPDLTFLSGGSFAAIDSDSLLTGDFTGDGRLDLAVANSKESTVSVLRGNGDGSFQPSVNYKVGSNLSSIVAGDFNGDGRTELAVARQQFDENGNPIDTPIKLLLDNSDGNLHVAITNIDSSGNLIAGDFNGDGRTDLASLDAFTVFLSNGDGTFQPQKIVNLALAETALSVVAGDFNGDGRTDFLGVTYDINSMRAYLSSSADLSNGDGTFTPAGQIVTTSHATPQMADVNGDGTNDVLLLDGDGNILFRQGIPGELGTFEPPVTVNLGNPSRDIAWIPHSKQGPLIASVDVHDNGVSLYSYHDGHFFKVGSLATGSLPAQIIATDLSGDGQFDLVVRNAGDGSLAVFFNQVSDTLYPHAPTFSSGISLPVGLGVSDLQAVDTTGDGRRDLVITNKLTAQLSIIRNMGDGTFAPVLPYRAGTGLSSIDPSKTPEISSLEATAAVAAAPLIPGGPTDLVTVNPGSNSVGILVGLGSGRFANPYQILTSQAAQGVRIGDFNHDGIPDLALLGTSQVTIMLGDGHGGFLKPMSYDVGEKPTGLTIADINGDGILDPMIGNDYGDLLILQGKGDGTFLPFRKSDQSIALAVADLTGNGKPDVIFADQGLDRVVVHYDNNQTAVVGDQSSGLLAPGAVTLADLNGDGIPDLIVANSGSNNVLIYPGLGNGQFGPAVNGGHGFFTGTNPTGITVANLNGQPDLIVANSGSNDVSILLGQGTGSDFTMIAGPRIKTDAGPVAVAISKILGTTYSDLAVVNKQANDVQIFPGVGGGFFAQNSTTYAVGKQPGGLFPIEIPGQGPGIAVPNTGSDSISLIGRNGVFQTVSTGGIDPLSGFAGDFTGSGFNDLVVGNYGDGRFALLKGGPEGLSLSQIITSDEVPNPTSLSFAGVSDGLLDFYAASAGREAAILLSFNLGLTNPSTSPVLKAATTGTFQQLSLILGTGSSVLDLIAPLFTVTVIPGENSLDFTNEGGLNLQANFLPSQGLTTLQGTQAIKPSSSSGGDELQPSDKRPDPETEEVAALSLSERIASGLDQAWEQVRTELLKKAGILRFHANSQLTPKNPRIALELGTGLARPDEKDKADEQALLTYVDRAIAEFASEVRTNVPKSKSDSPDPTEGLTTSFPRVIFPLSLAVLSLSCSVGLRRFKSSNRRFLKQSAIVEQLVNEAP